MSCSGGKRKTDPIFSKIYKVLTINGCVGAGAISIGVFQMNPGTAVTLE